MYVAEQDERDKGDVKVKEGIAFLQKFYHERASMLSEKRRMSNTSINSMDLMREGIVRTASNAFS